MCVVAANVRFATTELFLQPAKLGGRFAGVKKKKKNYATTLPAFCSSDKYLQMPKNRLEVLTATGGSHSCKFATSFGAAKIRAALSLQNCRPFLQLPK